MEIVRFEPEHLLGLVLQSSQRHHQPKLADKQNAAQLAEQGQAFTARHAGRTLAVAGVLEQWPGRGLAWALLSEDVGPHLLTVHRAVTRFLDVCGYMRIEMNVVADNAEGHRWARLLGFKYEGLMKSYTPSGMDCARYARVRD